MFQYPRSDIDHRHSGKDSVKPLASICLEYKMVMCRWPISSRPRCCSGQQATVMKMPSVCEADKRRLAGGQIAQTGTVYV